MPTFHHWRAGKQRNGLTFQTAADARAFDKGIIRAYDELIDGLYFFIPIFFLPIIELILSFVQIQCTGLNLVSSSQWPKMNKYNTQIDDDDVFMVGSI